MKVEAQQFPSLLKALRLPPTHLSLPDLLPFLTKGQQTQIDIWTLCGLPSKAALSVQV